MNKKKAYTGMKTPVLMKVGNSAALRVSAKPGRMRVVDSPIAVFKTHNNCCHYAFWELLPVVVFAYMHTR
jgi:hypothetical protein